MEVSMFIPTFVVTTVTIVIIFILLFSIFFFQTPSQHGNTPFIGISHKEGFSILNKERQFFSSVLKISAIVSTVPLIFLLILKCPQLTIKLSPWLQRKAFSIKVELSLGLQFKLFFTVALFVSWSILEFSEYYMAKDPQPKKFFRLLIIFLLNMIILTSAKKIYLLFIGWEGVGFLSFLLIRWWATRKKAKKSAIQAVIYNRIGDIGILVFFAVSVLTSKSWSMTELFIGNSISVHQNLLLFGILLAATGKSAQFGLHPWLPAAMEGPTPVSALLHRSTMVVAGIFLLIRLRPLYSTATKFKTWCLIMGAVTATFAATTAVSQYDIKKIVAYSTTSQLGLMMVAIGLKQPELALFHICTHAFFKAMLFLSSGRIIHRLSDEQDIRKMGGLHLILPKTSACVLLGRLALAGIPFLAGFYSKDLILETRLTSLSNLFGVSMAILATLLTSVYSARIIYFCFIEKTTFKTFIPSREENSKLTKSLKRLALGTLISGWLISSLVLPLNSPLIETLAKKLPLFATIIGTIFSISLFSSLTKTQLSHLSNKLNLFTTKQWFFEKLSHSSASTISFLISLILSTRKLDQGWRETLGAQGIGQSSRAISKNYQATQTGYLKQYMVLSFLTLLIIISAVLVIKL